MDPMVAWETKNGEEWVLRLLYYLRIYGNNLICYPGDAGTNTASLELIKLMLNSVIWQCRAQTLIPSVDGVEAIVGNK